jgi:hypothetical protein
MRRFKMYGSGFHLDPVKDVPKNAQQQAAGISLELEQEELKESQSLAKTVQGLSAEYQEKLRAIIGPENLERYSEFRVPLRQQVRDLILKASPTVVGEREIQEARRQAAEESREFLKEIGFNMPRASQLRGEYHTRIQKVLSEAIGRPEEPNYLVLPEMVPKDVHNPWVSYQPPYPGWAWSYWWNKSDEPSYPSFARYLNSASGQLGTYTRTHVSGADNSDWSNVRYRTAMRFWYYLPVAGMAEVWMNMQCIDTPYSGWLSDEWGWSDSACDQESHAYLRVIVPGYGTSRKSTILDYRRTGTDANWSGHVTWAGNHRWAHIFSADAYAGGTWLLLEAGTEEWNHFWSNDVSIYSAMTMRWFLSRVYVRSTGE